MNVQHTVYDTRSGRICHYVQCPAEELGAHLFESWHAAIEGIHRTDLYYCPGGVVTPKAVPGWSTNAAPGSSWAGDGPHIALGADLEVADMPAASWCYVSSDDGAHAVKAEIPAGGSFTWTPPTQGIYSVRVIAPSILDRTVRVIVAPLEDIDPIP